MESAEVLTNEDFYKQALSETEEYQRLTPTRRSFLERFLILFIHYEYVRDKNKEFAKTYGCTEKTIERYFSDIRKANIIEQKITSPVYDGQYHTERIMKLNSLLKAKILSRARELKADHQKRNVEAKNDD